METLEVIVYNKFFNPQKEYDALIEDFTATSLIDSLKIIGRPIEIPSIKFEIDTSRVIEVGIPFNVIDEQLKKWSQLNDINEISNQVVTNEPGQKIPLSFICKFYIKAEYYKPEVFIPTPKAFDHEGFSVVKIEFYLKSKDKKKLIEFIKNYANKGANKWEMEILN